MDLILELDNDLRPRTVEEREKENMALHPVTYRSKAIVRRYFKKHFRQIREIENLIDIPAEGEQYRVITYNAFNAFTTIFYLLKHFSMIDEIYLVTYNMNEKSISALFDLVDQGKIQKASIIISESINFRMPKRIDQLRIGKNERSDRIRLALAWNHAKITLAKCGSNYIVMEGSGNLAENAFIEQYVIDNDKQTYNFHRSWVEDIFNGKSVHKRQKIL